MITVSEEPGNFAIYRRFERSSQPNLYDLRQAWFSIGQDLKKSANEAVLKTGRQGRVYRVKGANGRYRRHRASRPGESFANITGRLRRSIQWKVSGQDLNFGYGVVSNNAPEYGEYLEFGTRKMAARPTIKNAANDTRRNAEQHLLTAIMSTFDGTGR